MQHDVQESLSQNPNPDKFEAIKTAHSNAISSNEKIFPIFAKKLSSKDVNEFVNTARKFAHWLRSERAYYPSARPKIVELFEIALLAFTETFIHHPATAELMGQLTQAVTPFTHLFVEFDLQLRLQHLLSTTRLYLNSTSSTKEQNEGSGIASIQTSKSTPPLDAHPIPDPQRPMWEIQPSSSTLDAMNGHVDGTVRADPPQAHNPSESAPSEHIGATLASPTTNTPPYPGENLSPTVPSKPQPKRVRRADLPEEIIARDFDWFKSQGSTTVNKDPNNSSSPASRSSPTLASDALHIPTQSPSPKKKTARIVPSRRFPRRVASDAMQEVKPTVSACAFPVSDLFIGKGRESVEEVSMTAVDDPHLSVESMDLDVRNPAGQKPKDVSFSESVAATPGERPVAPQIPQTDTNCPLVAHPSTNGETPVPPLPSLSLSIPEATLDGTEPMDISTPVSNAEDQPLSEPLKKSEPTTPKLPQVSFPCIIFSPLAKALEPPLDLNFRLTQTSYGRPQQTGKDANQRRFDNGMTVVHCTQGKSFTHNHTIDINLDENMFSKVTKWVNRKYHPLDAPQGICISLACYRLAQFFDAIKSENDKHDMNTLTTQTPCTWPSSNRLFLYVNGEKRHTIVTLSPPLILTSDQCVDISSLMKPGDNTLELRQMDDLSEYLIVLHAHYPTGAQLAELDVVKSADERWKRFLDIICSRVVPESLNVPVEPEPGNVPVVASC